MNRTLLARIMKGLIPISLLGAMLLPVNLQASIVTETYDEQMYKLSESELFELLKQQNLALSGLNFDSFIVPSEVRAQIGDRNALQIVGRLLAGDDSRGPRALANYLLRFPNDLLALYLAASELVEQKKYREAELTLQKILQAQPDFHAATNLLGLLRLSQEQYEVAGQIFTRVLLRDENPNGMAARYLAWLGMRNGNLEQAETALLVTLAKMPKPITEASPIVLELAELYRRLEKHSAIVELFADITLGEGSGDVALEAVARRFEAATMAGLIETAVEILPQLNGTAAYQAFPILLSRARLKAQLGDFTAALELIAKAQGENADFERNRLLEKAKILTVAKRYAEVEATLTEYLGDTSEASLEQWENYADLMIRIGRGNSALAQLRSAVGTISKSVGIQLLLIDSLIRAGDIQGAKRQIDRTLSTNPQPAQAHYLKGILLFDEGNNDLAADAFRAAVAADPNDISAWMALFGALHDHRVHNHAAGMAATDHADLMPLFDQAIAANPDSTLLYYEKGLTAYSGSELDIAREAFDKATAKAPLYVPAIAMGAIVRADLDKAPQESLALARRGEQLAPQNPAVLDAVGWALIQNNQLDEGLTYLNRALQLMPGDEAVLAHLAEAYLQMGDVQQGLTYVRDALKGTLPDHTDAALREHLVKHDPQSRLSLQVNFINGFGVGESAGNILITQEEGGVRVVADVAGLPAGLNGMHFHEKPSCEAGLQQGERVAGLAAGGHYGHGHMMMDMGDMDMSSMTPEAHAMHMQMMKPKGDLPPLPIAADGTATDSVFGANLTIEELRGRSLMIHQGPDVDGVSGPKIACAVIP
ncbi:tetratricopeptide repeat protein [Alteromonas flava]|uniref:tetratricopeptide repeat protein n=1 Tax=Alteromonas flava TaxID=2048003 RepID=UPI0013DC6F2D|nr:tetratricopeptide repeat protein [Alteromonas flava]